MIIIVAEYYFYKPQPLILVILFENIEMVKFVKIIIHNNFCYNTVSRVHDRPPKRKVKYYDKQQTLDLSLHTVKKECVPPTLRLHANGV